jgi:DNA helicase IV
VVEAEVVEIESEPESFERDVDEIVEAQKAVKNKWARPLQPEVLREALQTKAAKANPASEKQTNLVRVLLLEHFADRDDERHQAQEYLTGQKSFSDIDPKMISALLDWMKPIKSPDGSGSYLLDKDAKLELTMVARQFMADLGQQKLEV